jgi:DNA-binding NarL/FixJ family response regulator
LIVRVLIVDDDPLTAADIAASLEDGGHNVVGIAESFSEAMAVADSAPLELAIVDIGLKDGGTGVQLVRALKARHLVRSIVISAEREIRRKADSAGAVGYIPKPARPKEILRFIRSLAGPVEAFC